MTIEVLNERIIVLEQRGSLRWKGRKTRPEKTGHGQTPAVHMLTAVPRGCRVATISALVWLFSEAMPPDTVR
jgi:hypothetical protein